MAGQLAVSLGKKTAVPTVCLLAMMSPMMSSSMMSSSMVSSRSAPVKAGRGVDQNLSRFTTFTTGQMISLQGIDPTKEKKYEYEHLANFKKKWRGVLTSG